MCFWALILLSSSLVLLCLMPYQAPAGGLRKDDEFWNEERVEFALSEVQAKLHRVESEAIALLHKAEELAKRPKAAYYAIEFLGQIRSVRAVPVLCDRLLYEQKAIRYAELVDDRLKLTATAALVKVGPPAVKGLLRKIGGSETSDRYQKVAMSVLAEILRKENVTRHVDYFLKEDDPEGRYAQKLEAFKKRFQKDYRVQ